MDESTPDGDASKNAHYFRPTSIATGLPWHVARRKRDRQLIAAAKKGLAVKGGLAPSINGHAASSRLSPSSTMAFGGGPEGEGEEQVDISIDEALQRGADVNAADYNGNTALHYACEEGYLDVVEYLLQQRVPPCRRCIPTEGRSSRASPPCIPVVAAMNTHPAYPHRRPASEWPGRSFRLCHHSTPFLQSPARPFPISLTAPLFRQDISVDATATMDWTPLHSAAYKGRTDIIKMVRAE